MKKLLFIMCFLLICVNAFADKYYVFINNTGGVEKGQEAGQTDKGDVVGISPYTDQYKPTPAELARYKVAIMELDADDIADLLESETKDVTQTIDEKEVTEKVTVRARKRKIDLTQVSIEQEKEIAKTTVFEKVSVKPLLSAISK